MKLGVNKRLVGKKLYREFWRDIEGYEELYQVSNLGRVRGLNYNHTGKVKIMKSSETNRGYLLIGLSKNGKQKHYLVHRLVASAFIPNPENKPQIDHIDTDKLNNKAINLRWVTNKENSNNELTLKHFSEANTGENHPMFGKHHSEETRKKIGKSSKGRNSKKVICIEIRQVFNSMVEASEYTGVYKCNISACCRGEQKTAGGYHWAYYEEEVKE